MINCINVKLVKNVLEVKQILLRISEFIQLKNLTNVKLVIKVLSENNTYKIMKQFTVVIEISNAIYAWTKNALPHHMVFHYEPKFSCNICEKKFYNSSQLNSHMKFHFKTTYIVVKNFIYLVALNDI